MAIAKAEIFKIIHERLKRMGFASRILSIDNDLRDCLYELSNDVAVLLTSTTVTLTANTATVTKPTGLKYLYIAAIDEGNVLGFGSIEDYEKSIEGASGSGLSVLATGTEADSGTTTSTTANKLVDSAQNFETTVETNMVVKNTTDGTYAYVTAIDSDTTLTLSSDIMASGEAYTIYENKYVKPATGDPTKIHEFDGDLYVYDPIADSADTVRLFGVLEEDDVDDIDLHDRCREALVWGVMYRIYIGGELNPSPDDGLFERKMALVSSGANNCLAMYEKAKAALQRSAHSEPATVDFWDI